MGTINIEGEKFLGKFKADRRTDTGIANRGDYTEEGQYFESWYEGIGIIT